MSGKTRANGYCTCSHSAAVHRNQRGRCLAPRCDCLWAPPARQRQIVVPPARGRATVDGSQLLVAYEPPTPAQRILREHDMKRLERRLWREIELAGLPLPDELEYHWAKAEGRQYRADAYYRPRRESDGAGWLIEVDGGIWMPGGGGHSHPMHLEAQHERDNLSSLLGYRVLRFTSKMIASGDAVKTLRRALQPAERLV